MLELGWRFKTTSKPGSFSKFSVGTWPGSPSREITSSSHVCAQRHRCGLVFQTAAVPNLGHHFRRTEKGACPRSAIEDGLADVVAPAEELPGKIVAFFGTPAGSPDPSLNWRRKTRANWKKSSCCCAQTSHDFSLYKKSTLYRRIELRMGLHQLARIKDYVRCLRENPQESELDGALNFN